MTSKVSLKKSPKRSLQLGGVPICHCPSIGPQNGWKVTEGFVPKVLDIKSIFVGLLLTFQGLPAWANQKACPSSIWTMGPPSGTSMALLWLLVTKLQILYHHWTFNDIPRSSGNLFIEMKSNLLEKLWRFLWNSVYISVSSLLLIHYLGSPPHY